MRRRAACLAVLGLILAAPGAAPAADSLSRGGAHGLATGSRVRVTAPRIHDERLVGWVDRWTPDSLLLRVDPAPGGSTEIPGATAFPRAAIERLETSKGMKGHAVRGACIGFLVGSIGGFFVAASAFESSNDDIGPEDAILIWAGAAVLSATLGGLLGAAEKSERWQEARGF